MSGKSRPMAMAFVLALCAVLALGCSNASSNDTGTNGTAPATPIGLAISGSPTASSISLTWEASSGATGYRVYRSATASGSFSQTGSDVTSG